MNTIKVGQCKVNVNGEDMTALSFAFNRSLVEVIHTCCWLAHHKRWLPEPKVWLIAASVIDELRDVARSRGNYEFVDDDSIGARLHAWVTRTQYRPSRFDWETLHLQPTAPEALVTAAHHLLVQQYSDGAMIARFDEAYQKIVHWFSVLSSSEQEQA